MKKSKKSRSKKRPAPRQRKVAKRVKKPAKKRARKRARKESGSPASTLAGHWLGRARAEEQFGYRSVMVPTADLKTLCASVLSQDETKGQS